VNFKLTTLIAALVLFGASACSNGVSPQELSPREVFSEKAEALVSDLEHIQEAVYAAENIAEAEH
jgi:hypothetical protein